jgi:hypothetical protein
VVRWLVISNIKLAQIIPGAVRLLFHIVSISSNIVSVYSSTGFPATDEQG